MNLASFLVGLDTNDAFFSGHREPRSFVYPLIYLVTFTEYESDRGDQNLAAAVGPAVEAITRAIDEMGFFSVDDPLFDGDPTLRNAPALIVNRDLAGIWLSCFTYRVFRNGDLVDGQQFDLEYLAAHGSRSLRGRNVLVESDGGKEYRHELRLTIVRDHILGRWFNVNSQNFGAFQLQVHNLRLLMTGQHLGNANDNSVQSGEWKWLRVDLGRLTVADALSRLTRARLRPLKELEIIIEEHISRDKAVPLSDILARNGKKSSI